MSMGEKPYIFIGSSSEGLQVARAIQQNLDRDGDVVLWDQGAFQPGDNYLESLQKQMSKADFAILVLTQDDITISRNQKKASPRDNVLFELGLAIGSVGKDRCYFVYDDSKDFKLPSDLAGISGATYHLQESGNLVSSLATASNKIRNMISSLGLRFKLQPETISSYRELSEFSGQVEGCWWERVKPDTATAISFVRIYLDRQNLIIKLKGRAFDAKGTYTARWESTSSSIDYEERKVMYHWTGTFPDRPSEPFEGFGEISFSESESGFREGSGLFWNINLADLQSTSKKSFELRRCAEQEVKIMDSENKEKICGLIVDKIEKMF
jgi:hypothetical protein